MQGDLLLFAAGPAAVVNAALDKVRQFLAAQLQEIPPESHAIAWITDWPMFEADAETGRLQVSEFWVLSFDTNTMCLDPCLYG